MTLPIEVLYAILIVGASLILLAWVLILHAAYRQWKWRRRQRRLSPN